jgi:hypothetical protein
MKTYDVLIPTDPERLPYLYACLGSLAVQSVKPAKIFISLHPDFSDKNLELVAQALNGFNISLTLVACEERGMNGRLNTMLQLSESPLVMTCDDDCIFPSTMMGQWCHPLLLSQRIAACTSIQVMGDVVGTPAAYKPQEWEVHANAESRYNVRNGWHSDKSQFRRTVPNVYRPAELFYNSYMVKRSALDEVGGWSTALQSIGGEVDLAIRLTEADHMIMVWTDEYLHLRAPIHRPPDEAERQAAEAYLNEQYGGRRDAKG